jgi:hypothetical protein
MCKWIQKLLCENKVKLHLLLQKIQKLLQEQWKVVCQSLQISQCMAFAAATDATGVGARRRHRCCH